jgi:predicted patatin/cPLA2 family phospholipase
MNKLRRTMKSRKSILSIDGGGIRGLIPAMVLHHIEQQTGLRTCELFDVIAGTSTGGILALGLTCPDDGGHPRYRSSDLVDMYTQNAQDIFPHEFLGRARQLVRPKYPSRGREAVLRGRLKEARLADALTEIIVTAYDVERRKPMFFRSALAKVAADHDFLMRDVALATSAAPTYFAPVRLDAPSPQAPYALVDGGVYANNPGMCAFVDRSTVTGAKENTLMVSIGTGSLTRPLPYPQAKRWGLIRWGPRIFDVVFDGVSDSVDFQLHVLLAESYHRFQVTLDKAKDKMDDVGEQNLNDLKVQAEELIDSHEDELRKVCNKLMANRS